MAYNFPDTPTLGQGYSGYIWDGEKWTSTPAVPNTSGVIAIKVFTASGTYVPSPNMTSCVIECVGGGGGGAGCGAPSSGQVAGSGGGGGGGYARKTATAANIGVSQIVTIGVGGAAGAAGANAGGLGGVTSVGNLASANGGAGGSAGTPFSVGQSYASGNPGTATIGDVLITGGYGSVGCQSVVTAATGGSGGSSMFSGGGRGSTTIASATGTVGPGYGSGGGGACAIQSQAAAAGGAGAPGVVVITEYGMTALTGTNTGNAVRYDLPQGLSLNQMAQARSNLAVTKKNYIINGAMMISQENGSTLGTTNSYYGVDQFLQAWSGATVVLGAQQVQAVTPNGSPNRLRVATAATQASMAAADYAQIVTRVEGFRMADLMWGTTNAKTITLQFGFKGPAGTYHVAIRNNTGLRSYIASFVISAANTDTLQTFVVPGETTGIWLSDSGLGMSITISLAAGSSSFGALGWQSANFIATASQSNSVAASGTWELFDVSLTEGTVAPPFQVPDYAAELALCQRYWQSTAGNIFASYGGVGTGAYGTVYFPVMRAAPAFTPSAISYNNANTFAVGSITSSSYRANLIITAAGTGYAIYNATLNARL